MKKALVFASAILACSTMPLLADGFGTQVAGVLTVDGSSGANFFDPAVGAVPPGYDNSTEGPTVTIDGGIEFGVQQSGITYTFDFTGNTLTFINTNLYRNEAAVTFVFTDSAFTGFSLVSDTAGVSYGFSGNTLTIHNPGNGAAGTTVFDYTSPSSVTPEPSSIALLGTGALGMVGLIRKRYLGA